MNTNPVAQSQLHNVTARLGKLSPRYLMTVAFFACVFLWGVFCYLQQEIHGEIITGLRTVGSGGVGWGLYITFVVFFIGVSFAGITVAALTRLTGIEPLRPVARLAELLTIVALLMGASCVLADLGRPLVGLLNLPKYARPSSPFFGTFTMVIGGYLFSSLVYFFLACRADAAHCAHTPGLLQPFHKLWATGYQDTPGERSRHHRVSFWMSLCILPLLITAHSTLGFIFGIQAGRPGWFSALQAPGFVVMAGVSGIGVLIVLAALVRKALHLENVITVDAFKWLGTLLWVLVVVLLYFLIAEELTGSYAAAEKDRHMAHVLVTGHYSWMFWATVGSLVLGLALLLGQFFSRQTSIPLSVLAGLSVNVAAVLKRFVLVVASQTHGNMLAWPEGTYTPSWVELGVVIGLFGMGGLVFCIFIKVFPIVPLGSHEPDHKPHPEPGSRHTLRLVLTSANLLVGLTLAVVGFTVSARMWTHHYSDPVIPFSPVIFIVGVMLTFFTGAVYELVPMARPSIPRG